MLRLCYVYVTFMAGETAERREARIAERIQNVRKTLPDGVTLVCVSKFKPVEAVLEAYEAGERDFGESRVQELCAKQAVLPKDIRWHFIGHLQTNKVRQIVPFVHLIQSVDSVRLLEVIDSEAARIGRVVDVLLEVHTANEETKSGFLPEELTDVPELANVRVRGLMTMATNTDDEAEIHRCFGVLTNLAKRMIFDGEPILSFGMSDDYRLAIEDGSNMVRIGSKIFGERV